MSKRFDPTELVEGFSQLPGLPDVYFRVRAALNDGGASPSDLARVLGTDPSLATQILKTVNSPVYGQSRKVETLLRAVSVLGTQAISDLVFATTIMDTLSTGNWHGFDALRHWRLSLMTGMVARALGRALADRDRLFVEGLLSRVGQLVLQDRIGPVAAAVSVHAQRTQSPLHLAQSNFLGCHYGEVGAELLRRWQLPESICNAIHKHLNPPAADDAADVCILRIAVHLLSLSGKGFSIAVAEPILQHDRIQSLGLDSGDYIDILEACQQDLKAVEQTLLPASMAAA